MERKTLCLRSACHQTLISALSACILVFIWDGRFQLDTHTLAQISLASVLISPHPSLLFAPLCLYITDSFGVALTVCFIITCLWVMAQEEMDNGTEGA